MRRFALAMVWVAAGILEFERHRLEGLLAWHSARLGDERRRACPAEALHLHAG